MASEAFRSNEVFVIPAHAGIQVVFFRLAWIRAFGGMTDHLVSRWWSHRYSGPSSVERLEQGAHWFW